MFEAELSHSQIPEDLVVLREGSTLPITGICTVDVGGYVSKPIRTAEHISVLESLTGKPRVIARV